MNIIILGAAGFIGTNLAIKLSEENNNTITLVDIKKDFFTTINSLHLKQVYIKETLLELNTDFESLLKGQEIVYHLISTTVPTTSNQEIAQELMANIGVTAKILDACVKCGVKKVVFISSGGTVYGKEVACPLKENTPTNPINAYGLQKVTIEKLLYLYRYMYGLDYRVVRLANPYGPYQRPNGVLGAVTTFTYKALRGEEITVYGDGSIIRDYIYIEDAIRGISNIVAGENKHRVFNLGSGYGTSIKEVIDTLRKILKIDINVIYKPGRTVDVPTNFLDISRYEKAYGNLDPISLQGGIKKTINFMKAYNKILV